MGTGGDGAHSFNISTTSALIAAAGGMKVAKHGNRAASSKSGAADCLEALGVNINQSPEKCIQLLQEVGMYFFFAQKLDEISLCAPTTVCEFRDGWYKTYTITPEEFGLTRCTREDLVGGTPEENAAITRAILRGEKGPKRDAVLMNAGASLYIGGKAQSMAEGVKLAAELIDSGKAMETLEKLIALSNQ